MSETLRETLTRQALDYMRGEYEDELARICPAEWDQDRIDKLLQAQLDFSRYILDSLGVDELHSYGAIEHHVGRSCLELRARVNQEVALERHRR